MTMTADGRHWLGRREELSNVELNAFEEAITDAIGQFVDAGLPVANDDRRANFEAAFIRYIIESRPALTLVEA